MPTAVHGIQTIVETCEGTVAQAELKAASDSGEGRRVEERGEN